MRLCSLHDVAVGTALRVKLDGQPAMAVYNLGGRIYVTADRCTHQGASLSAGVVNGDTVECPLHGCLFRIATGEALGPPCVVGVKSYDVEAQGDDVMARVWVGE